ncbi:MAG: hypothetical protein UY26_C0002G0153 [Candidatus Jorgensenbacteria bacterium GW2011_GWA1_48_13]|uniref:Uncharacterized protein n=1 Tax=Candidatus Jorgensenbacteria bacterium GW2011_GWB1_50_10 TaxID=1618665 RepID=A0A0G1W995_9BACT|nr:MAG: hypothetical protein UY26_C0002G0153 [Candidatus Jorgensenbacteria bacterium GW2011_GWA1_48_13]KKW15358.1 MAG: hypothetical protein UY55_C0001G0112 [Candidatus Jorgensenbacteria bacterium GW2011_GWB1_50_10]
MAPSEVANQAEVESKLSRLELQAGSERRPQETLLPQKREGKENALAFGEKAEVAAESQSTASQETGAEMKIGFRESISSETPPADDCAKAEIEFRTATRDVCDAHDDTRSGAKSSERSGNLGGADHREPIDRTEVETDYRLRKRRRNIEDIHFRVKTEKPQLPDTGSADFHSAAQTEVGVLRLPLRRCAEEESPVGKTVAV